MHNPFHSSRLLNGRVHKRILALGVLAFALTACNPTLDWGPVESYYDGQMRSTAAGTATLDAPHGRVGNLMVLSDTRHDGNTSYAHTYWWFDGEHCTTHADGSVTCTEGYVQKGSNTTPEIADATTERFNFTHTLDVQANHARVASNTCVQLGWPVADECSGAVFATFAY